MAGYDPDSNGCASGLKTAEPGAVEFDICDSDKTEYRIAYNATTGQLDVTTGGGTSMPLAENVDAFLFRYLDSAGDPASGDAVQVVEVSMLVRSNAPDFKHTNTMTYLPGSGSTTDWILADGFANPANDSFHRRLLITSIALRN
jgi:hypothetical protein